jgi:hypothetical protein
MLGPGKYDALCTLVRHRAHARGAIVVVVGGSDGDGFSAQLSPEDIRIAIKAFREVADQLQADLDAIATRINRG